MRRLLPVLLAALLVASGCIGVYGPPQRPKPAPAKQGASDEESDSKKGAEECK